MAPSNRTRRVPVGQCPRKILELALTCSIAVLLTACASLNVRAPDQGGAGVHAPYPRSRLIASIRWDFTTMRAQRKALGSDLWPCAWAADGNLYCAWGDGGGFDGNDDNIGRVSLGFARVSGVPSDDPSSVAGKNVWGAPPYAESPATFGGKVGSVAAVNGILYANGKFWTEDDGGDPVSRGGPGPHRGIAWSSDYARSWQIVPWTSAVTSGSFLDMGQDRPGDAAPFLYLYYLRSGDHQHIFLERLRSDTLGSDPKSGVRVEYLSGWSWLGHRPHWSQHEADATPIFTDRNHAEGPSAVYNPALGRYLLTVGHYASGNDDDSSAGQVGLFEAPNPWGPWSTVGYYEDWGGLRAETQGDYLSLRIPSKWISADGRSIWAIFSGPKSFDSFNLVHGVLEVH